jgi:glycogen debranching enzyme
MLDIIEVGNQYYVRAQSSFADNQTKTLMVGDLFGVFDRRGDFRTLGSSRQGLFYREMRHLSKLVLGLGQGELLLLSSSVRLDNAILAVDLTNAEVPSSGSENRAVRTVHFHRSSFLWANRCYQRIEVRNYAAEPVALELILEFEADFADIFEVRGHHRTRRGELLEPRLENSAVTLGYMGLDGLRRETRIELNITPATISAQQIRVPLGLAPGEQTDLTINVLCSVGGEAIAACSEADAVYQLAIQGAVLAEVEIFTSNEQFNDWIYRSAADLRMLVANTPEGLYPYAGVPWFSTIFGRDGLVTALEYLWVCPEMAKGVLSYLAAAQATEMVPAQDAEPGKILHESRQSEMARTGEVPFGRYYGSIDSTPLFIVLAAAYFKRTGDVQLLERIWPNIEKALSWIDQFGDRDGDGFVEYGRFTPQGLLQQGWKDSQDSIFHRDGKIAQGPIALCEVQGYVYAAKRLIADVCRALGRAERAHELTRQAESLRQRFQDSFWCEEISSYAIALDGNKQRCQIRSSNAGQTLFTGIASEESAERIIAELGSEKYFSGWGVRTIALGEPRYNPMSYHNGSIWPHDNALIAYGLRRSKNKSLAVQILASLFEASRFLDSHRLPELFCGFSKRPEQAPTLYPVACAPQAWAAGAVFLLLQSCLGIEISAVDRLVRFTHPRLPESISEVRIQGLKINGALVDLELTRQQETVEVSISRKSGDLRVIATK